MNRLQKIYSYAEPNTTLVVVMGGLGYPVYYWVWQYLFPQPYENLWLRLLCSLLVFVLAFRDVMSNKLKKFLPHYYLFAIGFCLPFFFSYMMLMNNWSDVWVLSFMSSIFLHILLVYDTRVMLLHAFICVVAAGLIAHLQLEGGIQLVEHVVYLPIFAFTYLFGNLFYFRNQTEHEAKFSIAKSFGAGIAHEMRNPLSALLSSFEVIKGIIPNGNSSYRNTYQLNAQEIQILNDLVDDSMKVIWTGNETIDLLLTSIDQNRVSTSTFCKHHAKKVVENAVNSFGYKNASESRLVQVDIESDFEYLGSDTLLKYVIYNLLKNAFRHRGTSKFTISLKAKRTADGNSILVRDTGQGIEPDLIKNIFEDFYTTGKNGTFGLGLSFCRKVMMSFGGNIECRSVYGEWTEFELKFPDYSSNKISNIKFDLMKAKTLLYIGDEDSSIGAAIKRISLEADMNLTSITLSKAAAREEHQFEFNLIIIDGELDRHGWSLMSRLEGKLGFTEARIAFIHDENATRNLYFQRYVDIELYSHQDFINSPRDALDYLMFDELKVDMPIQSYNEISTKRTVMIVDDNHSLRSITSIMLEKQGLHVVQAENGKVALSTLEQEDVDLILMDIEMPVLDGLTTTKMIRESNASYASIPIVGYTGDKSEETVTKINEYGMNDFIVKPTPKDELIDKVATWI
ncbi:hybrid sensor histidine kinase/response regulator [Vibrio mediterranei]|jgi:two-component system CAI-1 autoinducer sensor kinase/phosphatase CqsS|uniref:histidine kinase n=2 Tax=Vibrio mediterranei TaxID=689 RepID=A0ABX5DHE4_9VIBR|nr:hybrid sensor histidine kinase/response regulator [Vibrio mediterranei]PCD88218.1 hybrid sensor histidine kinase/response regulator [Vibrio mediterranei]PRQ68880.1 hybrid sensor histidine kinase/response regulator [Vibrio mediterranei]